MHKLVCDFSAIGKPRMPNKTAYYAKFALKYWDWKAKIQWYAKQQKFVIGDQIAIRATFKMPKSWPEKKKIEMAYTAHKQKPDFDNVAKAVCDALHIDDKCVSDGLSVKRWGYIDSIEVVNLSVEKANEIERLAFNV